MNCTIHLTTPAAATCTACGSFFCRACLLLVEQRNVCQACAIRQLEAKGSAATPSNGPTVVVVQQQQQQQQAAAPAVLLRRHGSWGWFVFWVIVFWPIAIYYYFAHLHTPKVTVAAPAAPAAPMPQQTWRP